MAEQHDDKNSDIKGGPAGKLAPNFETSTSDDLENDNDLERVQLLAADAENWKGIGDDDVREKLNELAATTEEEVDALRVNLFQDDEIPDTEDGSGRVVDDAAEERLARFTEADPMQADIGAVSVSPGRDDTSRVLRSHHPNTTIARSDSVVEGNLDEPMDESVNERKVDEGTAG